MAKRKFDFNPVASYYADMLSNVRTQIQDSVRDLISKLGGMIYVRYYFDEPDVDRYTFFEVNDDGYGVELFINSVRTNAMGDPVFILVDTEDSYEYEWELDDFNASNTLYLLQQLEAVAEYISETGENVVTDEE